MPQTGQALAFVQTAPPVNTALAKDEIPSRKLFDANNGVPMGGVNAPASNAGGNFDFSSYTASGGNQMDNLVGVVKQISEAVSAAGTASTTAAASTNALIDNPIDGTNKRVANTLDAVVGVQTSVDANQLSNSSLFGFQTIENGSQSVWNFNSSVSYFTPMENMQVLASAGAAILISQMLLRLETSVNFLMSMTYVLESQGFPDVVNLNDAHPQDKPRDQPVLAWLQGVYPEYGWEDNHNGTGWVGMTETSAGDGIDRSYYWAPECPSLDDIFHLWDYTPTSGGAVRNGITDFISIISLLPVTY